MYWLPSCLATKSFSQDKPLLDELPTTKDDFVKSEPLVINTVDWLESTPLGQDSQKRQLLSARLLAWLTNSPTVTVEINSKTVTFAKKNPDLLMVFMAGWTRYCLQNGYSKDPVKCNLAGIKSAIKLYQLGSGIKKDKEMEKIIDKDAKNELESWIKSQLEQK